MKKNFFILVFLISSFVVLSQQKIENCLLWEISGNGMQQPSYIFGTVHLIPEDDFFFYDEWLEKLNTCEVLVLEADIDISVFEQLALVKKMKLPDETTLKDYMTEDEFEAFNSYVFDVLDISATNYKVCLAYKPFFSYSLLINDAVPGKKIVYEQYLSKKSKKNKMKIIGLETLDYQLSLIDDISIEDQICMFLFDFEKEEHVNLNTEYEKTVNYYVNQDLTSIMTLEAEDENEEYFYQNFLVNRNITWIKKLNAIFKKKTAFIAVGAAHLPGEKGVLQLLKDEGYTIKPVCSN